MRLALFFLLAATVHAAEPATPVSPNATPERIQKLVARLGNAEFYSRQQAETQLTRIGFEALDALGDAAESEDLEVASRASRLMQSIKSNWSTKDDSDLVRNLLRDYEPMEYSEREARIKQLVRHANAVSYPVAVPGSTSGTSATSVAGVKPD